MEQRAMSRRAFVSAASLVGACAMAACMTGLPMARAEESEARKDAAQDGAGDLDELPELPASDPDPSSQFGVDRAVNMANIDGFLNRPDVVYRDMRMLFDPADWESMDGDPYLATALEGFKIVPYPFLATLEELPVKNAYSLETLYDLRWDKNGNITAATPNYEESLTVLEDLFPRDWPIFLCCGGGGYAGMTKKLLVYLGWDPALLYNIGGMWDYEGDCVVDVIEYGETADDDLFATWRADYAVIDFTLLRDRG